MESLGGMDAAFLSLETPTTPMHVGAIVVLSPPEGTRSLFSPSTRYAQIRRVIAQRLHMVAPMRQRAPGAVGGGTSRCGWMIPSSSWTITSGQAQLAERQQVHRGTRRPLLASMIADSRSGPALVGDVRCRGARWRPNRIDCQGAPRHRRRSQWGFDPRRVLGPQSPDEGHSLAGRAMGSGSGAIGDAVIASRSHGIDTTAGSSNFDRAVRDRGIG